MLTYIALTSYTIFHLVFYFQNQGVLENTLILNVDPSIIALFNLMGLYPLGFLVFVTKYHEVKKLDYIPLGLGFLLGAYAITPYFFINRKPAKKKEPWPSMIALVGLILSLTLIGFGFILGNISVLMSAFLKDSFIHIMLIDFVALTLLSVWVLKGVSKHYYLALIPIVGFFYILFTE